MANIPDNTSISPEEYKEVTEAMYKQNLENVRLNKALEEANYKLQELDKLKTEFLSFASHQLRNPLTALKGYSSMVLQGDYGAVSDDIRKVFGVIADSTDNLLKMVQDFLDITKIESGGMKYDMQSFDLKELIENITTQNKPNIDAKGLAFTLTIPEGTYKTVGDSNKLRQVFLNLVDNSMKYTPKGSVAVSLTHIGDKLLFSVADTGVGLNAEDIPKLFAKFSRAPGSEKVNVTSTGLGLYLAKQIVEAHKGRVWVESPGKGKGSTFFVELPAQN